jgi:hypothetical protein
MMERRNRQKPLTDYKRSDIYKSYLTSLSEDEVKIYGVTGRQFSDIISEFNEKISNEILKGQVFKIPFGIGIIRIGSEEVNLDKLRIDFGHFRKTGEKRKHLNEHTNLLYYRFYWKKGKITNVGFYHFSPTRTNARTLAGKIKGGFKDYIPI